MSGVPVTECGAVAVQLELYQYYSRATRWPTRAEFTSLQVILKLLLMQLLAQGAREGGQKGVTASSWSLMRLQGGRYTALQAP